MSGATIEICVDLFSILFPSVLKQGIARYNKVAASVEWNDFTLTRCIFIPSILHNEALCLVAGNLGYFLILPQWDPDLNLTAIFRPLSTNNGRPFPYVAHRPR